MASETKKRFLAFIGVLAVVISILSGGIIFIYQWLGQSDFFQITSVEIDGCHTVAKDTVMRLSGLNIRSNLLVLNSEDIKQRIERHDWVESVSLKKKWPNRLFIMVRERRPQALLNTDDGLFYVDRKSEVFAAVDWPADLDFPVITGMEKKIGEDHRLPSIIGQRLKDALQFISYAGKGSSSLPEQNISELHLTEEDELLLFLVDRPFPIYLGEGMSRSTYDRLSRVLYWLYKKREFTSVEYIRMDYAGDKVLVGKNKS